jgi:hypothetical protein
MQQALWATGSATIDTDDRGCGVPEVQWVRKRQTGPYNSLLRYHAIPGVGETMAPGSPTPQADGTRRAGIHTCELSVSGTARLCQRVAHRSRVVSNREGICGLPGTAYERCLCSAGVGPDEGAPMSDQRTGHSPFNVPIAGCAVRVLVSTRQPFGAEEPGPQFE